MKDKLVNVLEFILPFLCLQDVVKLASCSSFLLNAIQKQKQFWNDLCCSSNSIQNGASVMLQIVKSTFSNRGALISKLDFSFCHSSTNEFLKDFFEYTAKQHNFQNKFFVKNINLSGCTKVTDLGLLTIAKHCKNLEVLELYHNVHITDVGVVPIIKNNGLTLKKLNFSGCRHITDTSIRIIASYCNTRLQHLDLTRTTDVTSFGIILISDTLTELKTLNLYACSHLTSDAFRQLSNCKKLENLDLCGCRIKDEHVKKIFANCLNLKKVNLTWCTSLSDDALGGIAVPKSNLYQNDKESDGLHSLSLHGIKSITPIGLNALISSRHRLSLTSLDIRGCVQLFSEFIDNDFKGLKLAFPNVKVFELHS